MREKITNQCPFDLSFNENRMVYEYLKKYSAHPDLVETLLSALAVCGDVQVFSPDINQCRYVALSTQRIIFGFAIDMNTIAFKQNEKMKAIALQTGATPYPECGVDWVKLPISRVDWPQVDLKFWTLKAYLNIREKVGLA
ncbi:MAG TPA: hypothetical protein VK742_06865 [Candidatus Sulfotelmatobacter sp.]|jgi:hypothetical protein|nr:hypothetical protein [Candidatus Sulfotelmatobacter sp.]